MRWLQTWASAAAGTFRIGRAGNDRIAEWVGSATLRADRRGSRVRFSLASGCDPEWGEKLRTGPAAALLRHLTGGVTLHAAAVGIADQGVLLLGESGCGKSTLAADLCGNGGASLLADDTAALMFERDFVAVAPTERVNWLSPEACARRGLSPPSNDRKHPVPPRQTVRVPLPLRAIVKLAFDDTNQGYELRRLSGLAAFSAVNASQFRFVLDEPEVAVRDFDLLERLLRIVPLYELRRGRAFERLQWAREAVASLVTMAESEVNGPDGSRNQLW